MTYEEAKTCIKANICYKQEACADDICKSTEERPCAIDVVIEALEKQSNIVHCKDCKNWGKSTPDGVLAEAGGICYETGWLCGEQGFCMYGRKVE